MKLIKINLKVYVIVFILSMMALFVWLYEVIEIKGWYSLQWIYTTMYSPYLISILVAYAYLSPFIMRRNIQVEKSISVALVLSIINIMGYEVGNILCRTLYCKYCQRSSIELIGLTLFSSLLFIIIGFSYWIMTHYWVKRIKKINILYIILILVGMIPLSFLTIHLYSGLGFGTEWVDAVKMGYPVFWVTFLTGLCGILISSQKPAEL